MEEKIKKETKELLHKLGIRINLRGYKYIIAAMILLHKNESMKIGDLYREIAKEINASHCNVERAIRFARTDAHEQIIEYFKIDYKITNLVFLKLMIEEISQKVEETEYAK